MGTEYLLVQAGACVAAVLLHDGIYIFFLEKGNILGWLSRMATEALPTALYTAAVGVGISAVRSLALGRRLIYAWR